MPFSHTQLVLPPQTKKWALRLLPILCLGVFVLLLPQEAHANIVNTALKAVVGMISGIADLLWKVAGMTARFMAWILVDFNQNIGFVKSPFVQAGWAAVRDVANWFFIIVLIVSAIATILDMPKTYTARSILPKLIVVALLINFSLFFTGFLVNFSQAIMNIFVVQGVSQYGDVGNALANAMRFGDATSTISGEVVTIDKTVRDAQGLGNYEEEGVLMAFHIIRGIFAIVSTFVFLFLAIMLIIRVVFLWMVMILSPLALVSSIFPALSQFWSEWLKIFVRWTFFGVLLSFFIWLSVYLTFVASSTTFSQQNFATSDDGTIFVLMAIAESFMQYLIVTIFLLMSVQFSRRFAGEGAGIAERWAGRAVSAPGLTAIAGGSAGVAALRQARIIQDAQARAKGWTAERFAGTRIGRAPIIRGAVRRGALAGEEVQKRAAERASEVSGTSDTTARSLHAAARTDLERLNIEEQLGKEGRLHRVLRLKDDTGAFTAEGALEANRIIERERKQRGAQSYALRSLLLELLDASPTTLTDPGSETRQVLRRMKSSDYANQSRTFWTSEIGKHAMAYDLQSEHVMATARDATSEVTNAMVDAINDSIASGNISPRFHQAAAKSPGLQALGIKP